MADRMVSDTVEVAPDRCSFRVFIRIEADTTSRYICTIPNISCGVNGLRDKRICLIQILLKVYQAVLVGIGSGIEGTCAVVPQSERLCTGSQPS